MRKSRQINSLNKSANSRENKILMISLGDEMLRHPSGNAARRHQEYAKEFGGKIDIITRSKQQNCQVLDERVTIYPTGRIDYIGYFFYALVIAVKLYKTEQPDLITSQDPFGTAIIGILLKWWMRKPLLIQNHSSFIDNTDWIAERPKLFWLFNRLAKRTLPLADAYRVVNEAEQQIYIEKLHLPSQNIEVIPVPMDIDTFMQPKDSRRLSELRKNCGIDENAPLLLWVGRPVKVKRIPFLLQIFSEVLREIPTARLLLIGDLEQAQEDLLAVQNRLNLGSQVIWLGYIPYYDLPNYYAIADIYLHTSIYEGFGRVMAEASAVGLPVVASRCAGSEAIIRDGETGYLAEPWNISQHVKLVKELLMNEPKSRVFGEAARRHVTNKFQPKILTENIVAQWYKVLTTTKERNR